MMLVRPRFTAINRPRLNSTDREHNTRVRVYQEVNEKINRRASIRSVARCRKTYNVGGHPGRSERAWLAWPVRHRPPVLGSKSCPHPNSRSITGIDASELDVTQLRANLHARSCRSVRPRRIEPDTVSPPSPDLRPSKADLHPEEFGDRAEIRIAAQVFRAASVFKERRTATPIRDGGCSCLKASDPQTSAS
jgi:hypothetical protein